MISAISSRGRCAIAFDCPSIAHRLPLDDVRHLESWQRAAAGLMRMYQAEVLGKMVVVQHLPFGELFKWA